MSHVHITQHELQEVYELDRDIAQRLERSNHLKENLRALLIAKMPTEPGRFHARLVWRTVRHPAWKTAVIEHLGVEFAEEFRKAAPANTLPPEVFIEEHAVEPLWKGLPDTGTESHN
jgi:hypothetical protein